MRERRLADIFILGMIYLSAFLSVILLAGIIGYVFVRGIPTVGWSFLTTV